MRGNFSAANSDCRVGRIRNQIAYVVDWSGRADLNCRPLAPQASLVGAKGNEQSTGFAGTSERQQSSRQVVLTQLPNHAIGCSIWSFGDTPLFPFDLVLEEPFSQFGADT